MKIRNCNLGEGKTKICVPIVEKNTDEIVRKAKICVAAKADVIEWRMDYYDDVDSLECVQNTLKKLREAIGDTVLLATFRTKEEGGEREIESSTYVELCKCVAVSKDADLVDVEVFRGCVDGVIEESYQQFIRELTKSCYVVGSYHDFSKTPDKEEIVNRLTLMYEVGVSIPKIAVMPNKEEDVIALLDASVEVHKNLNGVPLITMSMGKLGAISRLAGRVTGSVMTFASMEKTSAPGQIPVGTMRQLLDWV